MSATLQKIQGLLQSGDFDSAHSLLDSHIEETKLNDNELVQALYLKAVTFRYQNKPEAAINILQQLLEINKDNSRAFQELGYCFFALKQLQQSEQAFDQAIKLNPALIASWQKLIELYQLTNRDYSGLNSQLSQLKALPRPLLGAIDLMHEGSLYKAEQVCRKYLSQNKHNPDAMCLLAEIGAKLKVFDDAEFLLESCVELYPENQQAKGLYINLLNRLGKFDLASTQASEYLQMFPNENTARTIVEATLANCRISLGDIDTGKNIYHQILQRQPKKSGIHLQLGHSYKTEGDFEQAISAYQHAIKLRSYYGDAYWSLANTKTYRFSDYELTQMRQGLAEENTGIDDQIHLNFALGKAYEDLEQFDLSFEFYSQGNQLKRSQLNYDADKTSELIQHQIEHCTTELFAKHKGAGNLSAEPIFILGLPRAGSTLLEQILASHSLVDGTMELHNILSMVLKLRGRIASGEPLYPANLHDLSAQQLAQLGDTFIQDTAVYRQGAPFFVDKMPNNFIHVGLIKLILPNAKIIDARRSPMACCFSGFKQLFGEGHEFSYDQQDIGRYYQDYLKLMNHWEKVLPGQILTVNHEELVNNFEFEVRRILDYCQLPFEAGCLEFYNNKRAVHTPSAQQVRQPISSAGLEQWKAYEEYLKPLQQSLIQPS